MSFIRRSRISLFWRIAFFAIGVAVILGGFAIDGLRFFGRTTISGAFQETREPQWDTRYPPETRYIWRIKYDFWVNDQRYSGYRFLRGSRKEVKYSKLICYIPVWPSINWIVTDDNSVVYSICGLFLGFFFFWLSLKTRLMQDKTNREKFDEYLNRSKIRAVYGLDTKQYLNFTLKESLKGWKHVQKIKIIIFVLLLCSVWYFLIEAKLDAPRDSLISILSMLTYAQAGLYGGIIDMLGGLLGRILFASFFLQLLIDSDTVTNYTEGEPPEGDLKHAKMANVGGWLVGFGLSFVLFDFMTGDLRREDSIIGLVMFFYLLKMSKDMNNRFIGFLESLENGEPKNPRLARKVVKGMSIGFLTSFIFMWFPTIIYYRPFNGIIIALIGCVFLAISWVADGNSYGGSSE